MKNPLIILLAIVILAAGGYWLYAGSQTPAAPADDAIMTETDSAMPVLDDPATSDMMAEDNLTEVIVEGSEFAFSPDSVTLAKDVPVRLVFRNTGDMTHDWVVDELGVRTAIISAEQESIIEFTPTEAGTFEYYCSVGNHREMGMVGTLVVE